MAPRKKSGPLSYGLGALAGGMAPVLLLVEPVVPLEEPMPEPVEVLVSSVFLLQPPNASAPANARVITPADLSLDAYISVSFKNWSG
jgi:hypothetical protein